MPKPQSYEHHTYHPIFTYIANVFMLATLVCIVAAWMGYDTTLEGVFFLLLAVTMAVLTGRLYTTSLQDRIIRLEMRVRAEKLLTPEQLAMFDRLEKGQIVALRFASDEELPELMRRALDESLSRDEIKRAIKNWMPDYYRT